jgi:site-specific recombinase XerD
MTQNSPSFRICSGFALACEKAGISDVTWHTLRHTFASPLVNRGVDIVTVKELLGHSSISVTMRYAHTISRASERRLKNWTVLVTIW